ncbi:MAG: AI-2E family transporter [Candidatus Eremiobacteraeota bacterium]|nr:AI-2E family transporter [Candidatus Eremiobacteraeota bacterium]
MTPVPSASDKGYVDRAVEASIHIGLAALLVIACLLILKPFIPLVAWGFIIAVASYPLFLKMQSALGGRGGLAATLYTLVLLALLIIPVMLLAQSLIGALQTLAAQMKDGTLALPPPPEGVAGWPIIGARLHDLWQAASNDLTAVAQQFAPQIKSALPTLLSATAGLGFTVLQFLLAIVVAGLVLANAPAAAKAARSLFVRIFAEKGPKYQELVSSTIRSVTNGILGVAVIQTVGAGLGFLVFGLPGAGLWTVIFLIGAVLQLGLLVMIPAIIYMFAIAGTTKAVIFAIWCIIVGGGDAALKPLLLGRGVAVPMVVVFLGAIGGFVVMGIIGLFVGAIVLSVGYELFLAWIEPATVEEQTV